MVTTIKSQTPGVVIVGRDDFMAALGAGLATMASMVIAPRFIEELFPFNIEIAVDGENAHGWIHSIEYATNGYFQVNMQFMHGEEPMETNFRVDVDLNFQGNPQEVQEFETTWDEPDDLVEA